MKEIVWLEAPSNIGLIEPAPGVEPGVRLLPETLAKAGLPELMGIETRMLVPAPQYTMNIDADSKVRNADAIVDYSRKLGIEIQSLIESSKIPFVVGGDCSILIGAALAMKILGNYGIFYIDGHTDYMWPEFSQTAGAAGMDLAIICGKGHDKLTNIDGLKPYVKEENVFCFGNREYDPEYVQLTLDSDIHYFDLQAIRNTGVASIINEFLAMVQSKSLDGFYVHMDVDVLNDELMPCVDSRTPDGLWYDELKETLKPLIDSPFFKGIEITILDPTLDPEGVYTRSFVKEIGEIFMH